MTVLLSSQTIKSTVQVRGRLKKVTVGQLLNKFTAVYGESNVHFLVHNGTILYVSLIQTNSVNTLMSHFFFEIQPNVIMPSSPSPKRYCNLKALF